MFVICFISFLFVEVCNGRPSVVCPGDELPCNDGFCIQVQQWCDSEVDCKDGSDEAYCYQSSNFRPNPNKCDETFFMCKDGPCIPLVGRCDGYRSCRDNSDEEDCATMKPTVEDETEQSSMYLVQSTSGLPTTTLLFNSTLSETILTHVYAEYYDDSIQADSSRSKVTEIVTKDLEKGFLQIATRALSHARLAAQQWLLSVRNEDFGWGDDTPRALTALYMSYDDLLGKQYDSKIMSKQLHLQIFTALIRNRTVPVPLGELSLYINALSATCENPRNFYGQDLVSILRYRTDNVQMLLTFITPLVYITLCLNNESTKGDLKKIQDILHGTPKIDEIGIEALMSIAATCISRSTKFAKNPIGRQASSRLYNKIAKQGLPENIYKLSLVTQALNEARINQDLWNRSKALRMITHHQDTNGSFGDILSTYYTIPILAGRSLLSLSQHCENRNKALIPLEVLKNGDGERIYITYTLDFGSPVQVSQTLMMKVKKFTNFFDVMRMAETMNPIYKFKHDMSSGKPLVYSIGGVVNDPEQGLYWRLYVKSRENSTDLQNSSPYEGDIRSFIPRTEDVMVFWMKSLY